MADFVFDPLCAGRQITQGDSPVRKSRLRARLAASIAVFTVGLVSIGVVAAPASAADGRTLPSGSSLYAISCSVDLALASLDGATAVAKRVGDGAPELEAECAEQGAWNPVTSTAYYSARRLEPAILSTIDLTTGESTSVGIFMLNGERNGIDSMAIGNDGAAYAIQDDTLYSLALDTAALTKIGTFTAPNASALLGFSVDPATGLFYAVNPRGYVFQIDVKAASATPVGRVGLRGIFSLQIDTAGVLWMQVDSSDGDSGEPTSLLESVSLSDLAGSAVSSGTVADADGPFYTTSFLFVPGPDVAAPPIIDPAPPVPTPETTPTPAPKLANSGIDAAPIAAGGALVALLGVALLVPTIRRRRTAA